MLTLTDITYDALPEVARRLAEAANGRTLWAFYGEMGAGKTSLIKAIGKHYGITGEVSSPTFSLVNEYRTETGSKMFHFDFYRIRSIEEVYDIGYEDYFSSGQLCLMEWPEQIEELLEDEELFIIRIEKSSDSIRKIVAE